MRSRSKSYYGLVVLVVAALACLPRDLVAQKRKKNKPVLSKEEAIRRSEFFMTEGEKYFIIEDFTKAVGQFQTSLKYDPQNDAVFFKLAQIYQQTKQVDKAKESIATAINLNKKNKYYYLLAVDIYTSDGDLASAATMYEELLSELPDETQYLFNLAANYFYQNKLDKALAIYDKTEKIFGVNEKTSFEKQKIFLKQNDIDKAIEEGLKLTKAFQGRISYVYRLAELYSANGFEDKATDLLKKLLINHPESSGARLKIADIDWKNKNISGFKEQLTRAFKDAALNINSKISMLMKYMALLPNDTLISILPELSDIIVQVHPQDPNGYLLRGDINTTLLNRGYLGNDSLSHAQVIQKAIISYSQYIQYDQSKFAVWQNLLNLELQAVKSESLASHAEQALELFPNQAWLYLINGVVKLREKNPEEAINLFEEGKKRSEDNSSLLSLFYSYLGDTYYAIQEYQKSDDAYESALQLNPNNYLVLNNYSYYLSLRMEKLSLAKKMSTKLIQNNPENNTYLDTYAWVHYALGDYVEAKRVLEKVINTGDLNAEYFNHYGDVLYQLGDVDNAVFNWQKAKDLDKTLKNIDKKITLRKIVQ